MRGTIAAPARGTAQKLPVRSPYQTIQPGVLAASARAASLPAVISSAMPILPFDVLPGTGPLPRCGRVKRRSLAFP
ncbi:hypothetical protein Msi02_66520 [Microbispora siamensis]|uniref:Uncharacterized protein n=1 Tax=Microbispora siamensis TaxID=564413 RepID=A0ABQ4GWN3_9ACTN|nr:hypothetical protein Msi02_66520 [Microbispora siamensis]